LEPNNYLIEYDDFEGPASLLLEVVRKRKVDIYKIELNVIISEFQEFIKKTKNILLDTISGFTYIASILLEIKSRSIIPSQDTDLQDDDMDFENSRLLLMRERQLKTFQKISSYLEHLKEIEELYYIREAPIEEQFIDIFPDIFKDLNIEYLNKLASGLLIKNEFDMDLSRIYTDESTITIFDEMRRIREIINNKSQISFKDLSSSHELLIDKIVCFLSILELYKNEYIDIVQFENFGDILIKKLQIEA
jgi:segregation and condensation protein A